MKKQVDDCIVLGRKIGTFTGWDHADTFVIQFYDFEPLPSVGLPQTDCLTIDFNDGKASWTLPSFGEKNQENWKEFERTADIVNVISHLPKYSTED